MFHIAWWTLAWHVEESEDTRIRRSEGQKIQESEDLNLCLGGIILLFL